MVMLDELLGCYIGDLSVFESSAVKYVTKNYDFYKKNYKPQNV